MSLVSKLAREYKNISLKYSGVNPFFGLKNSVSNHPSTKNLVFNTTYFNQALPNTAFNTFSKFDSPSRIFCPDHLGAWYTPSDRSVLDPNIIANSTYSCKNKTIRLALRKKRRRLGERVSLRYR